MTFALGILGLVAAVLVLMLVALSQRHRHLNPRLPARSKRPRPAEQLRRLQSVGGYRGVKIEARCGAASSLAGPEFDFDEVPSLPARGCDAEVCECAYIGLPERRRLNDRRNGADRREKLRLDVEDRRARARRKGDLGAWASVSHP